MNKIVKRIVSFVAIFLFVPLCTSCTNFINKEMPNEYIIDDYITNHLDDIQIVSTFLLELHYEFAYIDSPKGQIYVDKENNYIDIEDSKTKNAISNLWVAGCHSITKSTQYNSIQFLLWRNTFSEIDCGFVCPIYDSHEPNVNYLTQLIPVSDKWYYYVSDYNKWRESE